MNTDMRAFYGNFDSGYLSLDELISENEDRIIYEKQTKSGLISEGIDHKSFHVLHRIKLSDRYCRVIYWIVFCNKCKKFYIKPNTFMTSNRECKCHKYRRYYKTKETRLFSIWQFMIQRCYDEQSKDYRFYGKKGITINEEWMNNYDVFAEWAINNSYLDSLSLDRINPLGNYEPINCRFANNETQNYNKSNTIYILDKDLNKHTVRDVCIKTNMPDSDFIRRLYYKGFSYEDIINQVQRLADSGVGSSESKSVASNLDEDIV